MDPIEKEVRNLVLLQRQANQLERVARAVFRAEVLSDVYAAIAKHDPTSVAPRYQAGRVDKLLAALVEITGRGYTDIRRVMVAELVKLGASQSRWAASLISDQTELLADHVGRGIMRAILRDDHMHGLTLGEWIDTAEGSFISNATRAIRNEVEQGVKAETIRRAIAGPVARTARRHIDAIARTAVTFMSNRAHMKTYEANEDVLSGVEFLATLDDRTTVICASWDGTVWRVGDPDIQRPPLHVNCRSQIVPVVDFKGLGLDPPQEGTRASSTGQTTAKTYEEWFRRLPPSRQDDIIGPARARLFRRNEISFKDMVTRDNRIVRIEVLQNA